MAMESKPMTENEKELTEKAASALRVAKEALRQVYPAGASDSIERPVIGSLAAAVLNKM